MFTPQYDKLATVKTVGETKFTTLAMVDIIFKKSGTKFQKKVPLFSELHRFPLTHCRISYW